MFESLTAKHGQNWFNLVLEQELFNGTVLTNVLGTLNHTANGTGHNATMTHTAGATNMESFVCVVAELYDANGTFVSSGQDCYYQEMLVVEATSSTKNAVVSTTAGGNAVKATTVATTLTQLVVEFTHLAPMNKGALSAKMTVSKTWSSRAQVKPKTG